MYTRTLLTILTITIGMTSILFGNLTPPIHTAGQQQARTLKTREWSNEPIKLIAVKNRRGQTIPLGKDHLDDDEWLRGLRTGLARTFYSSN
jgi:hypothetical protein